MAKGSKSSDKPSDALSSNQLLEMYWFGRLAREIEERLVILFRQSKVIGGLYRSLGQEGESVGTAYALKRTDAVLPLIRNMGALTTIGVRPREIFLQYMAKGESNSRGRDLNIHIVHMPAWTRDLTGSPGLNGAERGPRGPREAGRGKGPPASMTSRWWSGRSACSAIRSRWRPASAWGPACAAGTSSPWPGSVTARLPPERFTKG